ncbi:MAG: restriction endonuclease subunit S, partial [Armatimonadota bacterium]
PNGVLAIVLPEGIFANLTQERVRQWLCRYATPLAIISLSRTFFAAKSCVLFARKQPATSEDLVLLAHAENETDLANIAQQIHCKRGLLKPVKELLKDMSPLHHLIVPKLRSVFPMLPLKTLLWEMRSGSTEYGVKRQFTDYGIPFLSAKTVTPFGIDLKRDGRFVAKGGPMDKPQAQTKVGDVVFVRVGVGCIGRAAAVLHDDETGVADDYLYILRFRTDLLLPEFFALFAQTQMFKQQLERIKRGTGTVTVPQRLLREILVPVPPMDVQQQFAAAYHQLHDRYRNGTASVDELVALVTRLEHTLAGDKDAA